MPIWRATETRAVFVGGKVVISEFDRKNKFAEPLAKPTKMCKYGSNLKCIIRQLAKLKRN